MASIITHLCKSMVLLLSEYCVFLLPHLFKGCHRAGVGGQDSHQNDQLGGTLAYKRSLKHEEDLAGKK